LFPPDDERLSLETCRGGKINTLKKVKKCVKLVENPQESSLLQISILPPIQKEPGVFPGSKEAGVSEVKVQLTLEQTTKAQRGE
jgi:hypothetical protein